MPRKKLSKSCESAKLGIKALTQWAEKRGYEVFLEANKVDEIRRIHKIINICTREPIENQLFGLAHECGHVMIEDNLESFKERYPRNYEYEIEGNRSKRWSKISLHQEIAEECEAWQKAEYLLKKLNIEFDKEKFDKLAAECVFTYVDAASRER